MNIFRLVNGLEWIELQERIEPSRAALPFVPPLVLPSLSRGETNNNSNNDTQVN